MIKIAFRLRCKSLSLMAVVIMELNRMHFMGQHIDVYSVIKTRLDRDNLITFTLHRRTSLKMIF